MTKQKFTTKLASDFLNSFIPTLDLTLSDSNLQSIVTEALYNKFNDGSALCNFQNSQRNKFIIKFKYNN
jgi:hypothetical protein